MSTSISGIGILTAFVVSTSVVLITGELYKRLQASMMKEMKLMAKGGRQHERKKVRFAIGMPEASSKSKSLKRIDHNSGEDVHETVTITMQLNRKILYQGMLQSRQLREITTLETCC